MDVGADERENGLSMGPEVTLLRILYTGDIAVHKMPAALAVEALLNDDWNGTDVRRARIIWGEVDARQWDMSA